MGNESYAHIGKRVKAYRNERGISQEELAAGICSSSTISLLETGQHVPSAEILSKIADRLVIPLHEILVDRESDLDTNLQVDIVKVYVESKCFDKAIELMNEIEKNQQLREYQKRELELLQSECLLYMGEKQAAVERLKNLQQKLEQARETDDHFVASVYNKLGTAFFLLANFTDAHAAYSRAYQLSLRFPQRDPLYSKISYNLGMVCRQLNRYPEAMGHLISAEVFFKENNDLHSLAATYFEFGLVYQASKEFDMASEYLRESLALYRALNMLGMVKLIRRTNASTVLAKTNPDKAVEELKECAREYEETGDVVRCNSTYAHLAHVLLSKQQVQEAGAYLQKALQRLSDCEAEKDPRLAYVYHVFAEYLLETGDTSRSIEYSQKSSTFFDEMGLVRNAADALYVSANAHRKNGDLVQAVDVLDQVSQKLRSLHHQSTFDLEVL